MMNLFPSFTSNLHHIFIYSPFFQLISILSFNLNDSPILPQIMRPFLFFHIKILIYSPWELSFGLSISMMAALAAATLSGSPVIRSGLSEPLAVFVSWTTTNLTPNCSDIRLMVSPPLPMIRPHLFPGTLSSTISMLLR